MEKGGKEAGDDRVAAKGGRMRLQTPRSDGWTKERRERFLETLATTANVTRACAAAGLTTSSARRLRRRDGEFSMLWEQMLAEGRERLNEKLLSRALGQYRSVDNPDISPSDVPDEDAPFDPELAIKVLQLQGGSQARRRRKVVTAATQGEVDAALMKRLEAFWRVLAGPPTGESALEDRSAAGRTVER